MNKGGRSEPGPTLAGTTTLEMTAGSVVVRAAEDSLESKCKPAWDADLTAIKSITDLRGKATENCLVNDYVTRGRIRAVFVPCILLRDE
ncbi:hypothetical protein RvY_02459 [Ramazzottius varieornatus]|uniref:Uncharacterized protein n=1 Tax=Ramazzottius varieornatus TaxID=947166 RepID=A0A1D1UNI9_RAMVA|nr:hypothetical protein RvY_02459 [Ramazzottius varieornatus]